MTKTYYPFDAGAGANVTEDQWRNMARHWAQTGVLDGELNEFAVFADSSGMQVKVPSGRAWVRGHLFESDAQETLAIGAADATNPRIDRVVIRADFTANTVDLVVLEGTPAVSPTAPALTQSTSRWEVSLARVAVAAGATTIAAGAVTDERTIVPSNAAYVAQVDKIAHVVGETVLGAASAWIEFTSIPSTYRHLKLVFSGRADSTSVGANALLRINNDTAGNYDWHRLRSVGTTVSGVSVAADTSIRAAEVTAATAPAGLAGTAEIIIADYAGTAFEKTIHSTNAYKFGTATTDISLNVITGFWRSTAAITSLRITPSAGNFIAGTTATLYGLKGA